MQQEFGDYTVLKQLGIGSLGEVVLAQHRFLKRTYVLKVLSNDFSNDKGFIQRFEKDVSALATLEHPNIVKMHNVSESQGKYYLVTDCIVDDKGEPHTLADYLTFRGGRLPEDEVVKIVHQIASALDFAHEKGFAHRNLKLSNILVSKKREGIHVYLVDFGLTRIAGNTLGRTYKMVSETVGTDPGKLSKLHLSFLHNYLFLAPEQKLAQDAAIDFKADIYAFGVLVYYLLTGNFPEGVFDMPSQAAPQYKLNWDRVVRSCLQSDPGKRPETLLSALEDSFSGSETAFGDSPKPLLRPMEIERPQFEADPGAIFQTDTVVGRYQPKPQELKDVDPLMTEMVVVRSGAFLRGSNTGGRDEQPRHEVILSSFAIDIHPVTNEQFVRFLETMGGEKDHNNNDIIRLRESRIKRAGGKLNVESGYGRHPVVGVTWYGAVAYARWVGKRLPTEAEWEAAASGGQEECVYPTGKNIERTQANFFSSDTTSVMSYPPNNFGLYDVAGNVYEWCQDWYDYHYYDVSVQEPNNPKGPQQGVYRILRGGCWKSLKEDLRCAHRHRNNPGTMNGTYGFRCAADVS